MADRACPRRPRPALPGRDCTRPHCDRCGGHDPIRDKPGDFAVCQLCRDEMDAEYEARNPEIFNDEQGRGYLRVTLPGSGARTVDLGRLAAVVASDEGWRRLCDLFGSDLDKPAAPAEGHRLEGSRMTTGTDEPFDAYCIVELMGHRRLAGHLREVTIAGAGFLRLDIPPAGDDPGRTQLIAPASVYAIHPVAEDVARAMAAKWRPEPVQRWELPAGVLDAKPDDEDLDDDVDDYDEDGPF